MTPGIEGPHGCRPEELPGVISLVDAAMRQGSEQTMLTDYPLVYAPGNLDNVQVVVDGGRPIATAPVLPRRVVGDGFDFGLGVISPTATDPPHQHRGHGSACVAACVRRMEALGLELSVLWTLVATFPFYERNGWQAVARSGGSYGLTADDAVRFGRWPGAITTLADDPARVADVVALHAAVSPRVARTLSDARALWFLPRMITWLAMDGERVAAYLVDSRASNKPGLLEAAGDPVAVAGLVREALERSAGRPAVDLHVGAPTETLAEVVRAALPERTPTPSRGDMMVRLNEPAAFLRAIRGWLEARAPASRRSFSVGIVDTGVTISLDWSDAGLTLGSERRPDHVELTRRTLASGLFGAHPDRPVDIPPALGWLPRFRIPIPVLDRS